MLASGSGTQSLESAYWPIGFYQHQHGQQKSCNKHECVAKLCRCRHLRNNFHGLDPASAFNLSVPPDVLSQPAQLLIFWANKLDIYSSPFVQEKNETAYLHIKRLLWQRTKNMSTLQRHPHLHRNVKVQVRKHHYNSKNS